ncbi:MAG: 3-phosphoshikimate 1-carboxyvinyltransferase [Sandaracinaceae bacterium]|nr:3-phosphoshikimate 1-carboxyvinyltransferase [Sandaracinaceae bacterium]
MGRRFRVQGPAKGLRGSVKVPGDKSIGHRALMFASLAEGRSTIQGLSAGLDNRSTAELFRELGVTIELGDEHAIVDGVGLFGLSMPKGALDCGNSGTTMRLVAGLLAGQRFGTRLIGDESLTKRPMRRIVEPLRARGAHIAGRSGDKEGEIYPPLAVAPLIEGEQLTALEYASPIASAQVKSSLLLSGLYAAGATAIREPVVSRDHTERMLGALGVPIQAVGPMVVLDPVGWDRRWSGFEWTVPGDISGAAFMFAAATMVPGSDVTVEGVGLNPTRTGILDALRGMRADLRFMPKGDAAGGEPSGDVQVVHRPLAATMTAGEMLTRMIDEVPAFCAIAATAKGRSDVRDAHELRVKESDRVATSAEVLEAFGVDCTELQDGLHVHGGARLEGARVASRGDHRIAMMAAVLGLVAHGETIVDDVECVATSFPGFADTLASLGADIVEEDSP